MQFLSFMVSVIVYVGCHLRGGSVFQRVSHLYHGGISRASKPPTRRCVRFSRAIFFSMSVNTSAASHHPPMSVPAFLLGAYHVICNNNTIIIKMYNDITTTHNSHSWFVVLTMEWDGEKDHRNNKRIPTIWFSSRRSVVIFSNCDAGTTNHIPLTSSGVGVY